MKKILLLTSIVATLIISCDKTQGVDIAKMIFDIIGYIFTAIIGAIGGNAVGVIKTEKKIEKDPTNNYTRGGKK